MEISIINELKELMKKNALALIKSSNLETSYETKILKVTDQYVALKNRVPYTEISKFVSATDFSLQCDLLQLRSKEIASDGLRILFPLGENTILEETRAETRQYYRHSDQVFAQFVNPIDEKSILEKKVSDLSQSGLSIRNHLDSKLMTPGRVFRNMKIIEQGGIIKEIDAQIIYKRKIFDLNGKFQVQVGMKIVKHR